MTNICHYRCFEGDRRLSMQIYADQLQAVLKGRDYQLESFQPHSSLEKFASNKFVMRYLRYWEYPRLVVKQKADIHHVIDHGYAHLLPNLSNGKKCITVHDLIPMLNWKGLISNSSNNNIPKPYLNLYSLSFLKDYDKIIADSNSTENDLIEYLSIDPGKISIIPPIISSIYCRLRKDDVNQFAKRNGLDTDCKWIMISGREFYKNHKTCLKVLSHLKEQVGINVKIIKTGLFSPDFDSLVVSMGLDDLVQKIYLENIKELPLLYNFVDCLLFPSLYEGFGMPVAEALACGTPVIISNKGSLPEIGSGLCAQFDPFDVQGMVHEISTIMTSNKLQQRINQEGPTTMKKYSNNSVSKLLNRFYTDLLND